MPKRYLFLISVFVVLVVTILLTRKDTSPAFQLKERVAFVSGTSEWKNTRSAIKALESEIASDPDNIPAKLKLAQAYIQEGRVTGDHSYYDALAFNLVHSVLKKDPGNFEALCSQATLEASAHQFTEALKTANKAVSINPYSAYVYGIICDAQVELGNYNQAVAAADKMVSIRPDLRSYSRIAYIREIFGFYPEAIDAMQMALKAGYPGLEQTEWVRINLGKLYEVTGNVKMAEEQYRASLIHRNKYAPALAGMGSIERIKGNYKTSAAYFREAATIMQDYSYTESLAELQELMGNSDSATYYYDKSVEELITHKHPTSKEYGIGHNVDRELAGVYLSRKDYNNAYASAASEYAIRPNNIDVNETMAWSAYHTGKNQKALYHIVEALRTNSKKPELLCKAALIMDRNNYRFLAKKYMKQANSINPNFNAHLLAELRNSKSLKYLSYDHR